MTDKGKSTTDQLLDLLVYAPVGMIWEFDKVLEQTVRRGRSQVQIARLMGTMAAKRGQTELQDGVGEVVEEVALALAKGITQFGEAIGLAPARGANSGTSSVEETAETTPRKSTKKAAREPAEKAGSTAAAKKATGQQEGLKKTASNKTGTKRAGAKKTTAKKTAGKKTAAKSSGASGEPLAGYDDLTAREIVPKLESLTAAQRKRVRSYEEQHRGRKTVLAKLDRLS